MSARYDTMPCYGDIRLFGLAGSFSVFASTLEDDGVFDNGSFNPSVYDKWSTTPLFTAMAGVHDHCRTNGLCIVEALIEANADVNVAPGTITASPPLLSAMSRDPKIVSLLLEHGADVNVEDAYGATPLLAAIQLGNRGRINDFDDTLLLQVLDANPNLDHVTRLRQTALSFALQHRAWRASEHLLRAGASLYAPASFTPSEAPCRIFTPGVPDARTVSLDGRVRDGYAGSKWATSNGSKWATIQAMPDLSLGTSVCEREGIAAPVGIGCLCFFVATIQAWRVNQPLDELERFPGYELDAFSRVHAHVRARRAWWRLRIVWGVRSLLFAWHERHATTPDQMDMAAELAAATEGMY